MGTGKKIAFYCDVPIYSGHDTMSAQIANVLSEQYPVSFYYVNTGYSESLSQRVEKIPLTLKNKQDGLIPLLLTSWHDILSIAKRIKEKRPDMIIICQGEYHLCLKGLIASRIAGVPLVLSYIPIGIPYSIQKMSWPFLRLPLYRWLERNFHGIITITKEQMDLIRKYIGSATPLYLLENFTEFRGTVRSRTRKNLIRLGIIGRLQDSKGQYRTIEIAEQILQYRRDFQFLFFGEGEKEEELKALISNKGFDPYFTFRGFVADKLKIYSEINTLLLLSDLEGLPLVLLEALYFKIPVLASRLRDNPVYERYIGEEFIFDTNVQLAEKIINFGSFESAFKKKAGHFRKFVIERHGEKAFRKNVLDLFAELAEEPADTPRP